ncbi:MAG: universal stress protein [SAR202 cluster bacterium]|nr:universal stress protein [SAR202 cluster bacterium]
MYQRILVPLDGSEVSALALEHARALAQCFGSVVHLLQVVDQADEVDAPGVTDNPAASQYAQDLARRFLSPNLAEARDYLSEAAAPLLAAGIRVEFTVGEGSPAEKIVEYAQQRNVDLIVMGTRGRGGIQRLVMGSVTARVLRASGLPVLVVPPPGMNQPCNGRHPVLVVHISQISVMYQFAPSLSYSHPDLSG